MPSEASCHSPADYARERELFRYCQGLYGTADFNAGTADCLDDLPASSPNAALTALAQLCALRLDAPRAMISVIDKETQYFIAEATRTLSLSDTGQCEKVGDELWVGCATVPKEGRLCERTIEVPPTPGRYACFSVTDLTQDERFNQLPFVAGPPHFKFYAGTPLTTPNGFNIGSLFVMDYEARPELTDTQIDCLGTIAKIVMQTMQLNSEAVEGRRALRMSQALQSFQDGKDSIEFGDSDGSSVDFLKQAGDVTSPCADGGDKPVCLGGSGQTSLDSAADPENVERLVKAESPVPEEQPDQESSKKPSQGIESTSESTFVRAANLLRESLDLHATGGAVFYNAGIGFHHRDVPTQDLESSEDDLAMSPRKRHRKNASSTSNSSHVSPKSSDVMSFSMAEIPLGGPKELSKVKSFSPIPKDILLDLLQRYPRGKMWSFNHYGHLVDREVFGTSEKSESDTRAPNRSQRRQAEAKRLCRYFPNVRQLLLAPLWDSSSARSSGACFCYSTIVRGVFSVEGELSFLMTFGHSVMAEVNRLANIAAERQKGDFVGSISHELRSPLHGILASAEFLADTEFDAFQNSLVDTISSCGRTLLDTINHILDYSKINKYERNFSAAQNTRSQKSATSIRNKSAVAAHFSKEAPPLMNIYATTDVAAIAEEVVEGVYAGQVYQNISSTEIAYMSPETKGKISEHAVSSSRRTLQGDSKILQMAKDVEVVLDIAEGDYVFTTQPGALRRILMNLFGNSLKYTNQGSIVVSMRLSDLDADKGAGAEEKLLEIIIQDTGKGISSSYIKTNLFTPFSQEDALATGVGLGLSIVKSIVNMLNGTIEFQSQIGKGTKVTVCLPLMRLPGTDTPKSTPSTITSNSSVTTSLQGLQSEHSDRLVVLYGFRQGLGPASLSTKRGNVLQSYITRWFGLKATHDWSDSADAVIIDEKDLPSLFAVNGKRPPTVVLCGASRPQVAPQNHKPSVVEFVSKPFGPYKLAKALFSCLEKAKGLPDEGTDATETFPSESPVCSETETIVPELAKININGQRNSSQVSLWDTGSMVSSARQLFSETSSRSAVNENVAKNHRGDFPFPSQEMGNSSDAESTPDLIRRDSRRPKITHRATEPLVGADRPASSAITRTGEFATARPARVTEEIAESNKTAVPNTEAQESIEATKPKVSLPNQSDPSPRLLLVDDNEINLRLLETFMRKRKYKLVDSTENGQLAVDAAMAHEDGYDIIFMDISMPIMNGFEATRAIREVEHKRRRTQGEGRDPAETTPKKALIIALTGLASSRDQTEAYESGVDLFMTKPVSFKEVGRLLDNWEAHGNDTQ